MVKKRALITGVTGQDGSYLAEFLLEKGYKVFGLLRRSSSPNYERVEHIKDKLELIQGDLLDQNSLIEAIQCTKPDEVYNLGAQSFVPTSWICPAETFAINSIGQINLFEAALSLKQNPKIQVAGSSEEYGQVFPDEIPMKETNPLRPLSPYAVSKVAQDLLALQYYKSYGLRTVRTRGFNHTGPRRGEVFICSNFAKQIAEIEARKRAPTIRVGNLEAQRDFTDVRDIVRAYWLALEKGEEGDVYNIGTGKAYVMKDILDRLLSMSKVKVEVEVDPQRLRPSDVPVLISDCSKFMSLTGWKPEIPFHDSLRDLLQFWRERISV